MCYTLRWNNYPSLRPLWFCQELPQQRTRKLSFRFSKPLWVGGCVQNCCIGWKCNWLGCPAQNHISAVFQRHSDFDRYRLVLPNPESSIVAGQEYQGLKLYHELPAVQAVLSIYLTVCWTKIPKKSITTFCTESMGKPQCASLDVCPR